MWCHQQDTQFYHDGLLACCWKCEVHRLLCSEVNSQNYGTEFKKSTCLRFKEISIPVLKKNKLLFSTHPPNGFPNLFLLSFCVTCKTQHHLILYLLLLMHNYSSVPDTLLCKILPITGLHFEVTKFFIYIVPYKLINRHLFSLYLYVTLIHTNS
jgi:hypothetical protein